MKELISIAPIVNDIKQEYQAYRTSGKSRDDALSEIAENYREEFIDPENGVMIMIGIVYALSCKKELTKEVALQTLKYISQAYKFIQSNDVRIPYIKKIANMLDDKSLYGNEARYACRTRYIPNWKEGDTFAHTITSPESEKLGISGWSILLYKVGEYVDHMGAVQQLMYLAVCPPAKEPYCLEELLDIQFLRTMPGSDGKWRYLTQVNPRNRKDELAFGLRKLGSFPGIAPPTDSCTENPSVSMPLFGILRKGDVVPAYEDQVCRLYKNNQNWK